MNQTTTDDDLVPEALARAILEAALREQRCAELLHALWLGGSATVDPYTRQLRIASAKQLGIQSDDP